MNNKDVFSLAKMKLKAVNSSYKHTFISYIISLVVFTLFCFMFVSFNQAVNKIIKENDIMKTVSLTSENMEELQSFINDNIEEDYDVIYERINVLSSILLDENDNPKRYYPNITIGDKTIEYTKLSQSLTLYENEMYTEYAKKYLKTKYNSNGFIAGTDSNNKNEVVISKELLDSFNMEASFVIGKKITFGIELQDGNDKNIHSYYQIIKDFIITGVYDSSAYELPLTVVEPSLIYITSCSELNIPDKYYKPSYKVVFDLENIDKAFELYSLELMSPSLEISRVLNVYNQINPLYDLISTTLLICSSLVFVISLLNIYITQKHLFNLKKDYMQMCYVNGMRKKDIYKEYVFENILLLSKPYCIYILTSTILCFVSMLGINAILKKTLVECPLLIKTNMSLFPLIIVIVLFVNIIFILLVSLMSTKIKSDNNYVES
ncbi:MAG: hypothetical protein ACI35W_02670 [Anaeroplasmataceae bacterium]